MYTNDFRKSAKESEYNRVRVSEKSDLIWIKNIVEDLCISRKITLAEGYYLVASLDMKAE